MQQPNQPRVWTFKGRKVSWERRISLTAIWEVASSAMSDNFTPEETPAHELFTLWAARVGEEHPDGLIPIYWSVEGPEGFGTEEMPFQPHQSLSDEDFLTHYTWPENAETGEPLNWFTLPVLDEEWNPGRSNKGGFIQEATGWKPSVLQPHVYLPALEGAQRGF